MRILLRRLRDRWENHCYRRAMFRVRVTLELFGIDTSDMTDAQVEEACTEFGRLIYNSSPTMRDVENGIRLLAGTRRSM